MTDNNKGWLCELPNGDFCHVNDQLSVCSCTEFIDRKICSHILFCKDVLQGRGRNNIYIIYSCFHKSIRMGLTEYALNWLWILLKITTSSTIKAYLIKMAFEEARHYPSLFQFILKEITIEQYVVALTTSKKKWELPYLQAVHMEAWVDTFFSYSQNVKSISQIYPSNVRDLTSCYSIYWYYKKTEKSNRQIIWDKISATKHPTILEFNRLKLNSSYALMTALEILCGLEDRHSFTQTHYQLNTHRLYIPHIPNWSMDIHTHAGWAKYKRYHSQIEKNEISEQFLDLRASGTVGSVGWRFKAIEQLKLSSPDLLKVDWSAVQVKPHEWSRWLELDCYFYPKLAKIINSK